MSARCRARSVPSGGSQQHRSRDDTGSATIELVLTIPVLLLALWFLVFCGRMADTRLRIDDAAHQAARAASSERTAAAAEAHARTTAAEALKGAGVTCRDLSVHTQGSMRSGGTARASVTCHIDLSDLALLRVPGDAALTSEFTSPVDVYRGVPSAHALSDTAEGLTLPRVASTSVRRGVEHS
ncbi:TadE family protein [Streptomyces fractus]|uniref:TadE family protein n=1 Tax=Streptomyces fractus TaxID=641806 RepID=UPI003CEBA2A1